MPFIRAFVGRNWIWIGLVLVAAAVYAGRAYSTGAAGDLRTGDCFDVPGGSYNGAIINDVRHQPCADPHLGEVIFVGDLTGSTDDVEHQFLDGRCVDAYRDYTGRDANMDKTYVLATLVETRSDLPTRGALCFARRADRQLIVGSIRSAH